MSTYVAYAYLAVVTLLVLALALQADHRALVIVFLLWLLCCPILNQDRFMLAIPGLGFDLQPTRLVLLLLLPALILHRMTPLRLRERSFAPLAPFEKLLIAYVVLSIMALFMNYGSLGLRQVINSAEKQLAFGVLYLSARDYVTRADYDVLERGIVSLGVFSAVVGVIQFVYDPQFFRVTPALRDAFGNIVRSTGVFGQEYEHAMYLTFVTIVACLWGRNRSLLQSVALITIFGVSVVATFQRMPWAVFLFAALAALLIRWGASPRWRMVCGSLAAGLLVLMFAIPWTELAAAYLPRGLVADRLLADTLTNRLTFNQLALSLIPKYPLGLGETIASPIYTVEFFRFGLRLGPGGLAYTVHNGFLSAAVRYGVAGGLAFAFMLFGVLIGAGRRATTAKPESFILPLIAAVLILYNVTEDLSSATGQAILIGGWLMGCFAGQTLYRTSNDDRISETADGETESDGRGSADLRGVLPVGE